LGRRQAIHTQIINPLRSQEGGKQSKHESTKQSAVRKGASGRTQIKTNKALSAPPQIPGPKEGNVQLTPLESCTCGGALRAWLGWLLFVPLAPFLTTLSKAICYWIACPFPE